MKGVYTWSAILAIVFASVVGDVLLARAMKQVGDVGELRRRSGLGIVIGRTLGNPNFLFGVMAMAVAFFSLLFALSWADLTYVLPATSLGYVLLALAARFLLHEHVSPLRWLGIALITGGVGFVAGGPEITVHPAKHPPLDGAQGRPLAKDARNGAPERILGDQA